MQDKDQREKYLGFRESLQANNPIQVSKPYPPKSANIVAIKDMADGNDSVGTEWQETKIFKSTDSLADVIKWGGTHAKITITLPDGEILP